MEAPATTLAAYSNNVTCFVQTVTKPKMHLSCSVENVMLETYKTQFTQTKEFWFDETFSSSFYVTAELELKILACDGDVTCVI